MECGFLGRHGAPLAAGVVLGKAPKVLVHLLYDPLLLASLRDRLLGSEDRQCSTQHRGRAFQRLSLKREGKMF